MEDWNFNQAERQVRRTFSTIMVMWLVMGVLSIATSAAVIYLIIAAARWLIANA